jgi:hypothetical protein
MDHPSLSWFCVEAARPPQSSKTITQTLLKYLKLSIQGSSCLEWNPPCLAYSWDCVFYSKTFCWPFLQTLFSWLFAQVSKVLSFRYSCLWLTYGVQTFTSLPRIVCREACCLSKFHPSRFCMLPANYNQSATSHKPCLYPQPNSTSPSTNYSTSTSTWSPH